MPFEWKDFLDYVDEGKVVPVVGPEVLKLTVDGETLLLDQYFGRRLAESLELPTSSPLPSVSEVAFSYLKDKGAVDRSQIYIRLRRIVNEFEERLREQDEGLEIPGRLTKLAEIKGFRIFVSTGWDSLLIDTLNKVRFGGEERTHVLNYSLTPPAKDLPYPRLPDDDAAVFRLFGKAATGRDECAVTAEDHLEFLLSLQDEGRRPIWLFDQLRESNLLLLGCSVPEWLVRFFVRTIKNERLADSEIWKYVADERIAADRDLVLFLELFKTQVYPGAGVEAFIDDLHRRWMDAHSPGIEKIRRKHAPPDDSRIFLSYAREDQDSVRKLKGSLDKAGLQAFFDEEAIPAASHWPRVIQDAVGRCEIFIACLSKNAAKDHDSYFRKEWKAAVERLDRHFGVKGRRFIWPVALDDLDADEAKDTLPAEFFDSQWERAPGGKPKQEFLDELEQEIRQVRGPK